MPKKTHKLNPQTLTYEEIKTPLRLRFYRFLRKVLIGFILALIVNFIFSYFFYTPKMFRIQSENRSVQLKYDILLDKIAAASTKLEEIKHRDVYVYRMLFAADSLDIPEVYNPYPDSKYAFVDNDPYANKIKSTWQRLDELTRRTYWQSLSLDELQTYSLDKERMALAIPAIWPLERKLIRNIGAYGPRTHPILGKYHIHSGIDLSAPMGTPIYATANGTVVRDSGNGSGYGNQVIIDHGFGYKTRYAHMSKKAVIPGQVIRRGEVIGEVGNTGRSTAPHLHYEVIYRNNHVDPINYLRQDMTEAEFEKVIESAKETTFERFDDE